MMRASTVLGSSFCPADDACHLCQELKTTSSRLPSLGNIWIPTESRLTPPRIGGCENSTNDDRLDEQHMAAGSSGLPPSPNLIPGI